MSTGTSQCTICGEVYDDGGHEQCRPIDTAPERDVKAAHHAEGTYLTEDDQAVAYLAFQEGWDARDEEVRRLQKRIVDLEKVLASIAPSWLPEEIRNERREVLRRGEHFALKEQKPVVLEPSPLEKADAAYEQIKRTQELNQQIKAMGLRSDQLTGNEATTATAVRAHADSKGDE